MANLISVTAIQRKFQSRIDWQDFASTVAFDTQDIASPIRNAGAAGYSYFTARALNGLNKDSRNNALIDYRVTDDLATIASGSDHLFLATVERKALTTFTTPEEHVFVATKVSENMVPSQSGGTIFKYIEDGYPDVIEYEVSESISDIINQLAPSAFVAVRNGLWVNSTFVELGQVAGTAGDPAKLLHNTEIPMDRKYFSFVDVSGGGGGTYWQIWFGNPAVDGTMRSAPTYAYAKSPLATSDRIVGISNTGEFFNTGMRPSELVPTEITVDITGLTDLTLAGTPGGWVIVNLTSSNATETISRLTNTAAVSKVTLRPASGLDVDFVDLITSGFNIRLDAATKTVYGTKDGYLELSRRGSNFYQTAYIDQYI